MELSIQEITKLTGVTSRALRHYGQLGLVEPSRIGANGYRYYDRPGLLRLQRLLLLRQLGVGLKEIGQVLNQQADEQEVLQEHLNMLAIRRRQVDQQIAAVEHTLRAITGKGTLVAEEMFHGFDHTQYQQEVEQRWGKPAYEQSNKWWNSMNPSEQNEWATDVAELNAAWSSAAADPQISPDSAPAQELARRHVQWLSSVPGTPAAGKLGKGQPVGESNPHWGQISGYVESLAHMYPADERFAQNYGGVAGAEFVRDALLHFLKSAD